MMHSMDIKVIIIIIERQSERNREKIPSLSKSSLEIRIQVEQLQRVKRCKSKQQNRIGKMKLINNNKTTKPIAGFFSTLKMGKKREIFDLILTLK